MSINYTTYVSQISNLIVTSTADTNFNTMLPGMIDYAEQRIYRELDLQVSRTADVGNLTPGSNNFTIPSTNVGTFVVIEDVLVYPSSQVFSSLTPVTKEYIFFAFPTSTFQGLPTYFAPFNNTIIYVGPTPDSSYQFTVVGTIRPTPLSASNSSTFLTQSLPDLFIAASMVFAAGYMRNYGAQADDPQMPGSWENQYKALFASANAEELRKRFQSQGWSPMTPNQIATPPRM